MRPIPLLKKNLQPQLAALDKYFKLADNERTQRRPPIDLKVYQHPLVVKEIMTNQQEKCAYCESLLHHAVSINVMHYRPLTNAVLSENGRSAVDYYAWYAYEWQNMMIACNECSKAIGGKFPLEGYPVKPMSTWQEAQLREKPLLLNPYTMNPSEHLMFSYHGEVSGRTMEGNVSITMLRLNRPELVRERARHFDDLMKIVINSPPDNLKEELSTYFSEHVEFSGSCQILLQNLCRILTNNTKKTEQIFDSRLFELVVNTISGLNSHEISLSFKKLQKENLSFSIYNTKLGSFNYVEQLQTGYIRNIKIKNFKDISSLELPINNNLSATPCIMLLGENATGKSSVLQAIKLALSSAKERSHLKKNSTNFIANQKPTQIEITFDNDESISLSMGSGNPHYSKSNIKPIAIGYGARRYFSTHPSHTKKTYINTTLFNPLAILRDPRDWLLEQKPYILDAVFRGLRIILSLEDDESITLTKQRELLIKTHGKFIPIDQLSDGYKSLFIMSIDIMRELLLHWDNLETAEAIVLIDEVENHLHPRWKMRVMTALREAMPKVQFICSTHDPLCLRGMKNGEVRLLQRNHKHDIQIYSDLPDITTLRIEQILSSDYFGLSSTEDPEQDYVIRRLAVLAGIGEDRLNRKERSERDNLLERYEGIPYIGSSPDRQILAEALTRHLRLHPSVGIVERGLARKQSIDEIMEVLRRAIAK